MQLRRVAELTDPVLPAVLDLYQTAFPVREQMLASFFWTLFSGESRKTLAVAEGESGFLGFAVWERGGEGQPARLLYLAVREEERGQGIGERLYRNVLNDAVQRSAPAVMYEVELPEEARYKDGAEAGRIAERRICWYRRLGAKSIEGVSYLCGTDWQAPIPMLPMIHPLKEITPAQAFDWGLHILAEGDPSLFKRTGEVRLV